MSQQPATPSIRPRAVDAAGSAATPATVARRCQSGTAARITVSTSSFVVPSGIDVSRFVTCFVLLLGSRGAAGAAGRR